jgi:hypothetical protein
MAEHAADKSSLPPHLALRQMLTGYWISQAIHVAAQLGLADLLKDGPVPLPQLARATGTHSRSLYRLLRALASVGVFAEEEGQRFSQTPLSECLRSDVPGSQRSLAIMNGEEHFRCWGDLLYSVQTGQTAFPKIFGQPIFDYLAGHPHQARLFDDAMVGVHGAESAAMLDVYDLTGVGTLVDIGGGNGSLLTVALRRYPALRGILFDRPDVVERARPVLQAAGLAERCTAVGGNFFESVPAGGDVYLMRHIIHDWDDEQCRTILRHCRTVVPPTGRLLIIETVIPAGSGASWAKFLDLNMLVIPGGMERTEAEYRELLGAAGFRLQRVVPTSAGVDVIESVPAER